MLSLQSKTGRKFAVDLSEVVSVDYDGEGVVHFILSDRMVLSIGGEDWGGPVSPEDAQQIIDMWVEERGLPTIPVEDLEPLEDEDEGFDPEPLPKSPKGRRTKNLNRGRRKKRK
jgi:hypothetical protein